MDSRSHSIVSCASVRAKQPFEYVNNRSAVKEPVSKRETIYHHTLPKVSAHGGFLRVGFGGMDTEKLTVYICEAVLVGHSKNYDGRSESVDSFGLHNTPLPISHRTALRRTFSLKSLASKTLKQSASRTFLVDRDNDRDDNTLMSFDAFLHDSDDKFRNVKSNELTRKTSNLFALSNKYKQSSNFHDKVNMEDAESRRAAPERRHCVYNNAEYNLGRERQFKVVVLLPNEKLNPSAQTGNTGAQQLTPEEYLQMNPEQFTDDIAEGGPHYLVKTLATNIPQKPTGTSSQKLVRRCSDSTTVLVPSSLSSIHHELGDYCLDLPMDHIDSTDNIINGLDEAKVRARPSTSCICVPSSHNRNLIHSQSTCSFPDSHDLLSPATVLNPTWNKRLSFSLWSKSDTLRHRNSHKYESRGHLSLPGTTISHSLERQQSIPENPVLRKNGGDTTGDHLDQLLSDVSKVVMVVMEGNMVIGEVAIPLRNLTSKYGWFLLTPVSPAHMGDLDKVLRGRRVGRFFPDSNGKDDSKRRISHRKLFSVRTALMSISFLQLVIVIVMTASGIYFVIMWEMHCTTEQLAAHVWDLLNVELKREFILPVTELVMAARLFYIPGMTSNSSGTLITSHLYKSYYDTLRMKYVAPAGLFVGMSDGRFYGAFLQGNGVDVGVDSTVVTIAVLDNGNLPTRSINNRMFMYGADQDCIDLETTNGCTVYNESDVISVTEKFDVTTRPWYRLGIESLGVSSSEVYSYFGGGELGLTVVYPVPPALGQPVKAVVGVDITLTQVSKILEGMKFYSTGYAFAYEYNNGVLLGSSRFDDLNVYVNCSEHGEVVVDRVRLYTSKSPFVQKVNSYLEYLCSYENICYMQATQSDPITSQCTTIHPGDLDCSRSPANETVGCAPLPASYTSSKILGFSNSFPTKRYSHFMPNGDILTIGVLDDGINGKMVVAVVFPHEGFTHYYVNILHITVRAAIAILAFSMMQASIFAHIVSYNLVKCTKNLGRFANLNFSTSVDSDGIFSPLKEIARVYEVMSRIRMSLRSFSKYVPPDVVRMLVQSGLEATLGGQTKIITCFCSDIVDFTTASESLDIEQLNTILGEYLQCMSEIIHERKGTVDKYIGDSIVAFWNAPEIVVDHAHRACEAALLCQARLTILREHWVNKDLPALHQRIGIHTGPAIVGNVGSDRRLNYTAMGNNVDFASQLEASNKKYGTYVLISDVTYGMVKESFVARPIDDVVLPSLHTRSCRLYELVAHRETATEDQIAHCERFAKAYTTFHDRRDVRAALRLLKEYRVNHLLFDDEDDVVDRSYDALLAACNKELATRKITGTKKGTARS